MKSLEKLTNDVSLDWNNLPPNRPPVKSKASDNQRLSEVGSGFEPLYLVLQTSA